MTAVIATMQRLYTVYECKYALGESILAAALKCQIANGAKRVQFLRNEKGVPVVDDNNIVWGRKHLGHRFEASR